MMQEEGLAIVLVEQHAEFALRLTQRAIILERGRLVHEGPSAALLENNDLIDRYVGVRVIEAGS
jgi:branched-chain amino acid transport system ATP-binding protein